VSIPDRDVPAADASPIAMRLDAPGAGGGWLRSSRETTGELAADDVLLEVAACGVCRTDLQIVQGDLPQHAPRVVPGHQAVGRVAATGRRVSEWKVGDRGASTWLAWACGRCRYCRSGRENLCERGRFTGWDVDGGYASHVRVHANFLVRLPDGISDLEAAPLMCAGVIGYRALRLAGLAPGLRLGLYGFGASAHLALQVACQAGAVVHVASRRPEDAAEARELGAASSGMYGEAPPAPLDAAVTFAPVGSVVVDALRALAPGGRIVINAIHLDGIPAFDYDLLWQERSIGSVANVTRQDAREFLQLAAAHGIRATARQYPLAQANLALQDLAAGTIGAPSAVLVPD
jgi:propanol-preferring alcohol dehydrogenase